MCPWKWQNCRFSTIFNFVYSVSSAIIDQSRQKLDWILLTIRSCMGKTFSLIRIMHLELSALDFDKIAIFYFVFTLSSSNNYQSRQNLDWILLTIRSCIGKIFSLIGITHLELSALVFDKIVIFNIFLALAFTNINESRQNLDWMLLTIRSCKGKVFSLIGIMPIELSALDFDKISIFDFVFALASTNIYQSRQNFDWILLTIISCMG